jgi:hypothetical protein
MPSLVLVCLGLAWLVLLFLLSCGQIGDFRVLVRVLHLSCFAPGAVKEFRCVMKLPVSLFGTDVGVVDIAGAFCKRKQVAKGHTAVEACRVLLGAGIIDATGAGTPFCFQRMKLLKEQGI